MTDSPGQPRTVTVTGVGRVATATDAAELAFGVEATGSSPAEALGRCSTAEQAMVAAAGGTGLTPERISTQWASVQPEYDHATGRPRLVGYTARLDVTVRVDDVGGAGAITTAVLTAGGQAARLNGLRQLVTAAETAGADARAAAYADARAKAEQYAGLAGDTLGALVALSEGAGHEPPELRLLSARAASFDVRPEGQEVVVTLRAVWELQG